MKFYKIYKLEIEKNNNNTAVYVYFPRNISRIFTDVCLQDGFGAGLLEEGQNL